MLSVLSYQISYQCHVREEPSNVVALFSWYTAGLLGSFLIIILKLSFLSCAGSPVSLIGYPPLFCYHPYIGKV